MRILSRIHDRSVSKPLSWRCSQLMFKPIALFPAERWKRLKTFVAGKEALRWPGTAFRTTVVMILCFGHALSGQPGPTVEEFQARRQAYSERVKTGISVIFNAPEEQLRESRTDKDFFYLTGFSEPGAILVLSPQNPACRETLFIPSRDTAQERWTGPKTDVTSETAKALGVERLMSLDHFQSELLRLAESERRFLTVFPTAGRGDYSLLENSATEKLRRLFPFADLLDARTQIACLRMKKSKSELDLLKKAIAITVEGHQSAAAEIAADRFEYQVQAALEYRFRFLGATRPAFPSIVGSGRNSTILHYDKNTRQMAEGELVVVDIGAEFGEYAADITRTYPVSGKFSPRQREIYNIVLEAQEAALREVKPGVLISKAGAIHKAAYDVINTHGKDLQGNPLGQYFIHGTSHHLGLDVHDAVNETHRPLEPGMVITIEPGVYIPSENLGVRIEDDLVVTDNGYELLSKEIPRRPEDIERYMADSRKNRQSRP